MAFLETSDLKTIYTESELEAHQWREDYRSYERLAENGLLEGLDSNLPEVNDGSLCAALFKLPKRVVPSKLSGTVHAINRDEAWLSELANLQWRNEIIPNANMQAPFIRKWKDAVRKSAIYGSVPIINLFTERDGVNYSDFIVVQPQDVILEPGKVSDYDSDVIFWNVYYTRIQLENMLEEAKQETKESTDGDSDSYNKWNPEAMQTILDGDYKEERDPRDSPRQDAKKNTKPKGFKFCIAFQRGVNAPFYMYHKATNSTIREWNNPDPTGDVPVHFLYCYQDFVNPYGIGICKLAGGTQNVLDYMRQADILATQLGLRPPIQIGGNIDNVDIDSLVYGQDALWFTGDASVKRQEISNQVYTQLPGRISQYQSSLQKLIPTGDTSISSTDSGDPTQSKTPAGVKLAAANLSIDDEDFKDNLYITFEAVAKSMINIHFANMEGEDFMKLSDDERELLIKAGMQFPIGANGEMSNQMEIVWDSVRATFDFKVDAESDKAKDDSDRLEGLTRVAELIATDPTLEQDLATAGKRLNKGELFAEIIQLTTDNDKIITDISPEDQAAQTGQTSEQPGAPAPDPLQEQALAHANESHQLSMQSKQQDIAIKAQKAGISTDPTTQSQAPQPGQDEIQANVDAVMQQYGVDEQTALTALAAENAGLPPEDVMAYLAQLTGAQQ